ncbi:related to calpain-like protein [Rhynchosporium graminicola]|uniref:Related to calpain-like protein n=1 Tax=Rhynchosporium graminicola TaxID=2792576 RepID=A0A1E1L8M5_9HELO|nr:related to calpain-like protein [Rhynchosporium commune]
MRYRDADFDIDWDLKVKRGHCLNNLKITKFDIHGNVFSTSASSGPKSIKRVHEIIDKPTFLADGVSAADVKQGSLGNCWFVARIGIYGFVFHRDGEWMISIIDDKLYLRSPDWDSPSVQRHLLEQIDREDNETEYRKTYQTGSQSLFFAQCRDQNKTWVPLLEKAYAKAHGDYAALQGGWIGEGLEDLTGGVTTELLTSDILDTDEFWTNEILKVNKEFLFGCSTGILGSGFGTRDGNTGGHAYVVIDAREIPAGQRLTRFRNPWGKGKKGNWQGAWSDGSKELPPEIPLELNHKFGSDSVFWISYKDLLRKYQHIDRTRLFMDNPDWRISHKWMSVEVSWKAQIEQNFRIVLKKETPVLMVLSQLDDGFFTGLRGQDKIRLQFRLHEVDSLEEHDYRTGTYAVFTMVVAERRTSQLSVEDIVKAQCKQKVDNDKLAQVGMSYDIAHSKEAAQSEAKDTAQKALDLAKARETRIALRRKDWEDRKTERDVRRKQDKKEVENVPKDQSMQTDDVKEVIVEKKDKAVQTEHPEVSTTVSDEKITLPGPEATAMKDTDKAVQTEDTCGNSVTGGCQGTSATPQSSTVTGSPAPIVRVPRGPFPPPPPACDDDPTPKPRPPINPPLAPGTKPKPGEEDDEDEPDAEPWNAICIAGFRVYSKDEGLELLIWDESLDEMARKVEKIFAVGKD